MKRLLYSLLFSSMLAVGITVTGCGGLNKTIEAYETQLKGLEAKGVPDSILSSVRVHIEQIKRGKERSLGTVVKESTAAAKRYLEMAEQWYEATVQTAKPRVDSLVKHFCSVKASLSGLQLKEADSLLAIVDSYVKNSWYMQAQVSADELDAHMAQLLKDEENAKKTAAQISGTTWNMLKKHTGSGVNAVQKTRVTFKGDGAFEMSEEMKGQTRPGLKEDWLYQTWGTYQMKGDTIMLSTAREKRVRQDYVHFVGGKEVKKIEDKPYDSVISDGSKDRYYTFEYIKENFKK